MLITALAKHLPPSASTLHLLDIEGAAGDILKQDRADLVITAIQGDPASWSLEPHTFDAVAAYNPPPDECFLPVVLNALRPGGRLIMVTAEDQHGADHVKVLESAGYTRILIETGIECPLPLGTLMRGEKPHTTENTLERVKVASDKDADLLDWGTYNGRYLFLLIRQTPHKAVWQITPDDVIVWEAVTAGGALIAFSSLPKAVAFMQPAVLSKLIIGVHKMTKFSRETGQTWALPILINPTPELLAGRPIGWHTVDPATAATPDE